MGTKNRKPKATVEDILDDFEAELEDSDEDSVTQTLAKGMSDGFRGLVEFVKSGGGSVQPLEQAEDDEGDDDDAEEGESGDGDDYDADEDDETGYQDLNLGDDSLDVTEVVHQLSGVPDLLKQMAVRQRKDRDTIRTLAKAVEDSRAENAELRALFLKGMVAQAGALQPMAKAVAQIHADIQELPEPVVNVRPARATARKPAAAPKKPRVRGKRPALAVVEDDDFIGGSERRQKQLLVKAMNEGILDRSQRRRFHLHGQFEDDDTENAEVRSAIEALGTAGT